MPTNRYSCSCGNDWTFIGPAKERVCSSCQASVKPGLPRDIHAPAVMETVDSTRNIKWRDDFKEKAEKRNGFYNKKTAKEKARVNNETPEKFGITEDDARLI